MALEKEMETYEAKLPELQAHEGKFALVHGAELVDVFGTYEDALKAGYAKFSLDPFLIKQIHLIEKLLFVSRLVDPLVPHPRANRLSVRYLSHIPQEGNAIRRT